MREEWCDIEDYPGYKVSSFGNVRGPRKDYLTLVEQNGYYKVTLSKNGKHRDRRVNILVAEAFIPNPYNLPIVMHLDNNPLNNHVGNLAWGTHAENNQYMYDCGRHPINLNDEIREKAYEKRRTPVISINKDTQERREFISMHDAARKLGVSQQHIWGVLNGLRRSTGGYTFEYAKRRRFDNATY